MYSRAASCNRMQGQTRQSDTDVRYRCTDTGPDTGTGQQTSDQIIRSDTTDTDTVIDTDADITIHRCVYPGKSPNIWQNPSADTATDL